MSQQEVLNLAKKITAFLTEMNYQFEPDDFEAVFFTTGIVRLGILEILLSLIHKDMKARFHNVPDEHLEKTLLDVAKRVGVCSDSLSGTELFLGSGGTRTEQLLFWNELCNITMVSCNKPIGNHYETLSSILNSVLAPMPVVDLIPLELQKSSCRIRHDTNIIRPDSRKTDY